ASARAKTALTSGSSPAPAACAVNPVVLMRRKPKLQYSMLNTSAPSATAPSSATWPVLPRTAVSVSPSKGTAALASMIGQAMASTLRRVGDAPLMRVVYNDVSASQFQYHPGASRGLTARNGRSV